MYLSTTTRIYTMNAIQTITSYDKAVIAATKSVATSSARVYQNVYQDWQNWCVDNSIEPLAINLVNVEAFLTDDKKSKSTQNRRLSALRTLLTILSALDMENSSYWRQLKEGLSLIKIASVSVKDNERTTKALEPSEVYKVFDLFKSCKKLVDYRNKALVSVLFYTGIRRFEAANIRWQDVDLINGTIHIPAGKGDKARDVAIIGDYAIDALQEWKDIQHSVDQNRQYVFCGIRNRGNGELLDDAPLNTNAIWKLLQQIGKKTGIKFSPHDTRRTFGTEWLENNGNLADLQAQFGHAHASTTMGYAKGVDARKRRNKIKMRY